MKTRHAKMCRPMEMIHKSFTCRSVYHLKCAAVFLAATLVGTPVQAQVVELTGPRLARVTEVIEAMVSEGRVAGGQALLWQGGEVVYRMSEGLQDLESGTPTTDSTLYRIYSMTKPVTSVAALMLYEEGALRLDDPVSAFIPALADLSVYSADAPDKRRPPSQAMTVHDLLTHRAGLTYGFFSNTPVDSLYWAHQVWAPDISLAEFVDRLSGVPLLYEPGTRWHYSVATDVLGHVVEAASGQSLDDFFHERIFDPLRMHDTAFSVPESQLHRFSTLYTRGQGGALQAVDRGAESNFADPVAFLSGGGGLVSTLDDYLRFARMLRNGGTLDGVQLLKPETVALMTQDHLDGGPEAGWGFGLGVEVIRNPKALNEPGSAGTYGWSGAANTFFFVDPQSDIIAMLFTQLRPFNKNAFQLPFKKAIYAPLE